MRPKKQKKGSRQSSRISGQSRRRSTRNGGHPSSDVVIVRKEKKKQDKVEKPPSPEPSSEPSSGDESDIQVDMPAKKRCINGIRSPAAKKQKKNSANVPEKSDSSDSEGEEEMDSDGNDSDVSVVLENSSRRNGFQNGQMNGQRKTTTCFYPSSDSEVISDDEQISVQPQARRRSTRNGGHGSFKTPTLSKSGDEIKKEPESSLEDNLEEAESWTRALSVLNEQDLGPPQMSSTPRPSVARSVSETRTKTGSKFFDFYFYRCEQEQFDGESHTLNVRAESPCPCGQKKFRPAPPEPRYQEIEDGQPVFMDPMPFWHKASCPNFKKEQEKEKAKREREKERKERERRKKEREERLRREEFIKRVKKERKEKEKRQRDSEREAQKQLKEIRKKQKRENDECDKNNMKQLKASLKESKSINKLKLQRQRRETLERNRFLRDRQINHFHKLERLQEKAIRWKNLKAITNPLRERHSSRVRSVQATPRKATSSRPSPQNPAEKPRRRYRSQSEPRDLGRGSKLLPKTSVTASPPEAPYTRQLNKLVEAMGFDPLEVAKFARDTKKSASKTACSWVRIRDPYFGIRKKRQAWINEQCFNRAGPDALLDLSDSDEIKVVKEEWTDEYQVELLTFRSRMLQKKEEFPEVTRLWELFGFQSIRQVPIGYANGGHNKEQRNEAIKFLVEKYLLLIAIWKCQEKERKLPRVVEYFLFYVRKVVKRLDRLSRKQLEDEMMELLFWLPIHLGDTRTEICLPRTHVIEFARQLARTLLNDLPLLLPWMKLEEVHALRRLELANLRLETTEGPIQDWLKYWRPNERVGKFAEMPKDTRRFPKIDVDKSIFARKIRARSHSFSEFTEEVPALDKEARKEQERIRNLPPLHNVRLHDFSGLAI